MTNILARINRERIKASKVQCDASGKPLYTIYPNVVYMNIAAYKELKECAGAGVEFGLDHDGVPDMVLGMRIVKRAGEMECAFDEFFAHSCQNVPEPNKQMPVDSEYFDSVGKKLYKFDGIRWSEHGTCVHGNDFMTCAKCIPPIAKREFSGVPDTIKISMVNITPLAEWFRNQTAKEFEKLQFKFEQRMPEIGECGLVMIDNQTLFVTRTSHNYFHSYGYLVLGSMQIPIERAGDAVTLVRIDPSIEGDETIVKKDFGEPRELLAEWFKKTGFSF